VLVLLNYARKEGTEDGGGENNNDNIINKNKLGLDNSLLTEMKNSIYFDLIPQTNKQIYYMDLYNDSVGNENIKNCLKEFFSKLFY
jgi:hypothetical protein